MEKKFRVWCACCIKGSRWEWMVLSKNLTILCRKGGDGMRVTLEKKQGAPVHHVEYYVTASVTYPLWQDTTT